MDKLCFKRYRAFLIGDIAIFLMLIPFCILAFYLPLFIIAFMLLPVFLIFIIRDIYALTKYRKICENITPKKGTVINWESGGRKAFFASVIVCENGVEYSSPYHFTLTEAKQAVGKTVTYHITNDTLLIFEIKNL